MAILLLCVGNVSAYQNAEPLLFDPVAEHTMPIVPDDGVEIQNFTSYISFWNERLQWGFSTVQISNASIDLENYADTTLPKNGNYFHITNLTEFDEKIGTILNLTPDQMTTFIVEDRKQLEIDHQNYHEPPLDYTEAKASFQPSSGNATVSSAPPNSQSAPFALGKIYYAYIFVDFSNPGSDGLWTQNHKTAALHNASWGTTEIQVQAPTGKNTPYYGIYNVLVNGQNSGSIGRPWEFNGWIQPAVQNLGFTDTDGMVQAIKNDYGVDRVLLVFCTHDDKGAYTIPTDKYADWVIVSHWGKKNETGGRFDSEAGSYEHEILHQFGALDEWIGMSDCGEYSGLAVSPMAEMYTNTNHERCPGWTPSATSVMKAPYSTSGNLLWYRISDSTRKFIGWGDYDGDGILDPLDSFPYGQIPIADFTTLPTPATGSKPFNVQFLDVSSNTPTSWAWTFGDGGTGTGKNL